MKMKYLDFRIEVQESGWCLVFREDIFLARTINLEEARRLIWLQLKGTHLEVEMITQEMMTVI